jgi:hypothetical protein
MNQRKPIFESCNKITVKRLKWTSIAQAPMGPPFLFK